MSWWEEDDVDVDTPAMVWMARLALAGGVGTGLLFAGKGIAKDIAESGSVLPSLARDRMVRNVTKNKIDQAMGTSLNQKLMATEAANALNQLHKNDQGYLVELAQQKYGGFSLQETQNPEILRYLKNQANILGKGQRRILDTSDLAKGETTPEAMFRQIPEDVRRTMSSSTVPKAKEIGISQIDLGEARYGFDKKTISSYRTFSKAISNIKGMNATVETIGGIPIGIIMKSTGATKDKLGRIPFELPETAARKVSELLGMNIPKDAKFGPVTFVNNMLQPTRKTLTITPNIHESLLRGQAENKFFKPVHRALFDYTTSVTRQFGDDPARMNRLIKEAYVTASKASVFDPGGYESLIDIRTSSSVAKMRQAQFAALEIGEGSRRLRSFSGPGVSRRMREYEGALVEKGTTLFGYSPSSQLAKGIGFLPESEFMQGISPLGAPQYRRTAQLFQPVSRFQASSDISFAQATQKSGGLKRGVPMVLTPDLKDMYKQGAAIAQRTTMGGLPMPEVKFLGEVMPAVKGMDFLETGYATAKMSAAGKLSFGGLGEEEMLVSDIVRGERFRFSRTQEVTFPGGKVTGKMAQIMEHQVELGGRKMSLYQVLKENNLKQLMTETKKVGGDKALEELEGMLKFNKKDLYGMDVSAKLLNAGEQLDDGYELLTRIAHQKAVGDKDIMKVKLHFQDIFWHEKGMKTFGSTAKGLIKEIVSRKDFEEYATHMMNVNEARAPITTALQEAATTKGAQLTAEEMGPIVDKVITQEKKQGGLINKAIKAGKYAPIKYATVIMGRALKSPLGQQQIEASMQSLTGLVVQKMLNIAPKSLQTDKATMNTFRKEIKSRVSALKSLSRGGIELDPKYGSILKAMETNPEKFNKLMAQHSKEIDNLLGKELMPATFAGPRSAIGLVASAKAAAELKIIPGTTFEAVREWATVDWGSRKTELRQDAVKHFKAENPNLPLEAIERKASEFVDNFEKDVLNYSDTTATKLKNEKIPAEFLSEYPDTESARRAYITAQKEAIAAKASKALGENIVSMPLYATGMPSKYQGFGKMGTFSERALGYIHAGGLKGIYEEVASATLSNPNLYAEWSLMGKSLMGIDMPAGIKTLTFEQVNKVFPNVTTAKAIEDILIGGTPESRLAKLRELEIIGEKEIMPRGFALKFPKGIMSGKTRGLFIPGIESGWTGVHPSFAGTAMEPTQQFAGKLSTAMVETIAAVENVQAGMGELTGDALKLRQQSLDNTLAGIHDIAEEMYKSKEGVLKAAFKGKTKGSIRLQLQSFQEGELTRLVKEFGIKLSDEQLHHAAGIRENTFKQMLDDAGIENSKRWLKQFQEQGYIEGGILLREPAVTRGNIPLATIINLDEIGIKTAKTSILVTDLLVKQLRGDFDRDPVNLRILFSEAGRAEAKAITSTMEHLAGSKAFGDPRALTGVKLAELISGWKESANSQFFLQSVERLEKQGMEKAVARTSTRYGMEMYINAALHAQAGAEVKVGKMPLTFESISASFGTTAAKALQKDTLLGKQLEKMEIGRLSLALSAAKTATQRISQSSMVTTELEYFLGQLEERLLKSGVAGIDNIEMLNAIDDTVKFMNDPKAISSIDDVAIRLAEKYKIIFGEAAFKTSQGEVYTDIGKNVTAILENISQFNADFPGEKELMDVIHSRMSSEGFISLEKHDVKFQAAVEAYEKEVSTGTGLAHDANSIYRRLLNDKRAAMKDFKGAFRRFKTPALIGTGVAAALMAFSPPVEISSEGLPADQKIRSKLATPYTLGGKAYATPSGQHGNNTHVNIRSNRALTPQTMQEMSNVSGAPSVIVNWNDTDFIGVNSYIDRMIGRL